MPDVAENMNSSTKPAHAALDAALALQRAAYLAHPVTTFAERKRDLQTLQRYIRDHKQALCEAISALSVVCDKAGKPAADA